MSRSKGSKNKSVNEKTLEVIATMKAQSPKASPAQQKEIDEAVKELEDIVEAPTSGPSDDDLLGGEVTPVQPSQDGPAEVVQGEEVEEPRAPQHQELPQDSADTGSDVRGQVRGDGDLDSSGSEDSDDLKPEVGQAPKALIGYHPVTGEPVYQ